MQLQKSLEQHEKSQKILKSVVVQHIGVGAVFGVAKDFFPNSPKLTRKKSIKVTPKKKKSSSCYFGSRWASFCSYFQGFDQIFRNFVKVFRDFAQISTNFSRILRDFARIFITANLLGVLLHPRLLHQWCSIKSECCDRC